MQGKADSTTGRVDPALREELLAKFTADAPRKLKTRLAASFLFFEHGIYPSAGVVRDYIQQGSLTDISRDLREFWQEMRDRSRVQINVPCLPPDLVEGFGEGLAKVWELALSKAQAELESLRQESMMQVVDAQQQTQDALREQRRAEENAVALEVAMQEERVRREQAELRAEALSVELGALQSSLRRLQDQVETETAARAAAEERFSRDLAAERSARQHEAERFSGESRFAKIQIDQARTEARELREQLRAMTANKDVELSTYRQRLSKSEEAHGAARLELAEMTGKLRALELQMPIIQQPSRKDAREIARQRRVQVRPLVRRRSLR